MFLPLNVSGTKIEARVANFLCISPTGGIMEKLRWLGLFSNEKIGGKPKTPAEVLTGLMIKKMPLPANARDMVVLIHEVEAVFPKEKNRKEKFISTLVDYGAPEGFTAIAKTVGLPAAIAAQLLLQGDLPVTGCQIPTHPVVYTKVLEKLETMGLKMIERSEPL
ncbi:MAG: hypothetical protein KJ645_09885 [Planctomycetes bacterium]|nr:hypothetical protein [Planctomycetota bacterium]